MLTFTNQAALSYRNRVRYSNLTTGQIADALTVSKEALTGVYGPEDDAQQFSMPCAQNPR